MSALRATALSCTALALAAGVPGRAGAVAEPPPCPTITVSLDATIDTKNVRAGDLFSFTTAGTVSVDGSEIPAGTHGVGVVQTMDHAKSQGQSGYLVLDARYLTLANGTHVPVAFVPGGDGKSPAFVRAGSSDAGVLTLIPFYIGTAASVYDAFHHGKNAAVVGGTAFAIVLGDGYFSGACRLNIDRT